MNSTIGSRIRKLRQGKGWNQSQVAKMLDISVPAFSKIETNITDMNISRLTQVAGVFGVSINVLLFDEEDPERTGNEQLIAKLREVITEKDSQVIKLQGKLIELYERVPA